MYIKCLLYLIMMLVVDNVELIATECAADKDADILCGAYCYRVVKPLLQHASDVFLKEQELRKLQIQQTKFEIQNDLVLSLKAQLATKDARISELENSIEAATIEWKKKLSDCRSKSSVSGCSANRTDIQQIKVYAIENFPVPCSSNRAGPDWIVIQRRTDASVNFNQNWNAYCRGFGSLEGGFFLGLEKIHLLTTAQPHELYIYIESHENENRYAHYDHFLIGNASESFEIKSLGKYTGTASDSLRLHNHMKFSTFDHDNDLAEYNCADEWLSGWWFNDCYQSNLNGLYQDNLINKENGIRWNGWTSLERATFVEMLIRPKTQT